MQFDSGKENKSQYTMTTKKIKLRAFKIANNELTQSNSNLLNTLTTRLNETIANDRRMVLNQEDIKREEDLISDFNASRNFLTGVVLRITHAEDVPNIPDQFLEHKKISINELDSIDSESSIIYKEHYYFLLNNEFVITNLRGNLPVKRFQVYLNWILEELRGDKIFELTPVVSELKRTQLRDLRSIIVTDSSVNSEHLEETTGIKQLNIPHTILSTLFNDVNTLDEMIEQNIISAVVTLKFKKPKSVSKDEYQKFMGAYLKPISETDDISFMTKNNGRVTGSEILKTKNVDIELTDTSKISEPALYQEMEKFLSELTNENRT
jgi:hypothetical protein